MKYVDNLLVELRDQAPGKLGKCWLLEKLNCLQVEYEVIESGVDFVINCIPSRGLVKRKTKL